MPTKDREGKLGSSTGSNTASKCFECMYSTYIYIYTHTVYILYVYYIITACHILFYCHHHRKQKCDPVGCSGILKSEGPVCDGQDKNVGRPSQGTNPKQYQIESDRVGCKLQSAAMSQQFL